MTVSVLRCLLRGGLFMMSPGRAAVCIAAVVAIAAGAGSARAGDAAAQAPAMVLPSVGDARIDAALVKLAAMTELAVVQVDRLAVLAAEKHETADRSLEARERRVQEIAGVLYSDQVEPFQRAYEEGLPRDEAAARQWARARLGTLFGRMEVNADLRSRALAVLIAAGREAKSYDIVRALLPAGKQKEMDDEWKRRQERRLGMTQKDLAREFAPRTDEQRKKVDEATAAFRAAARDLDLDSPEYGACVERYRRDLEAALQLK